MNWTQLKSWRGYTTPKKFEKNEKMCEKIVKKLFKKSLKKMCELKHNLYVECMT